MDNKKDMNPTKELYEKLLNEVYEKKQEERELALDRYRRADENMDTSESFVLMGKNAISFLKLASDCSDSIASLAKEIKSIVYKDDAPSEVNLNFNDMDKRAIIDAMAEEENKTDLDNTEDSEDDYE